MMVTEFWLLVLIALVGMGLWGVELVRSCLGKRWVRVAALLMLPLIFTVAATMFLSFDATMSTWTFLLPSLLVARGVGARGGWKWATPAFGAGLAVLQGLLYANLCSSPAFTYAWPYERIERASMRKINLALGHFAVGKDVNGLEAARAAIQAESSLTLPTAMLIPRFESSVWDRLVGLQERQEPGVFPLLLIGGEPRFLRYGEP